MPSSGGFWSRVTSWASWLFLSPVIEQPQQPVPLGHGLQTTGNYGDSDYPVFKPPGGRLNWEGSDFNCSYPAMEGWEFCSTPGDRSCWLKHPNGSRFDSQTDYERFAPIGVERYYEFNITDGKWNADGFTARGVKYVNEQYPGPWVQACWGDTIIVNVTNNLHHNGTAIHWHGIRQLESMEMDGVPGITQCPIAPKDHFVYKFAAVQYGSSWYHSHYSVQYADGMLGPLTIHGPVTAAYDEAKPPTLMSDWFHRSAFEAIHNETIAYPSILLNGTGDVTKYNDYVQPDAPIPPKYTLHFVPEYLHPVKQAKKYLLRLINTSFDTAFVFSIDHHLLQVVSADFVPIEPYQRSHILIGIGQRYNVIVEARPLAYEGKKRPLDDSFWIRTTVVKCFHNPIIGTDGYDRTGILRYNDVDTDEPTTKSWPDIPANIPCRDEHMESLVPRLKWNVGHPANGKIWGQEFDVNLFPDIPVTKKFPLGHMAFDRGNDDKAWNPFQIDYNDPIFLNLNETDPHFEWDPSWFVVPEDYTEESWVYLALAGVGTKRSEGAHPIHLHGHDFALLQQEENLTFEEANINLKLDNPPRRDVVLLPNNGFVVIAFKTDNPGAWIMHCHIAFHASWGLALQILERQNAADALWPKPHDPAIVEANRVCKNWNDWQSNCENWWPGWNSTAQCYPSCPVNNCTDPAEAHVFMDDSGI